jgi:hypothetical protein
VRTFLHVCRVACHEAQPEGETASVKMSQLELWELWLSPVQRMCSRGVKQAVLYLVIMRWLGPSSVWGITYWKRGDVVFLHPI